MNEKEISEIRRRFRTDRSNITYVRGCYVNEKREILSEFNQSMALLGQEENEKFLTILKKTLSGTPGKNLLDSQKIQGRRCGRRKAGIGSHPGKGSQ